MHLDLLPPSHLRLCLKRSPASTYYANEPILLLEIFPVHRTMAKESELIGFKLILLDSRWPREHLYITEETGVPFKSFWYDGKTVYEEKSSLKEKLGARGKQTQKELEHNNANEFEFLIDYFLGVMQQYEQGKYMDVNIPELVAIYQPIITWLVLFARMGGLSYDGKQLALPLDLLDKANSICLNREWVEKLGSKTPPIALNFDPFIKRSPYTDSEESEKDMLEKVNGRWPESPGHPMESGGQKQAKNSGPRDVDRGELKKEVKGYAREFKFKEGVTVPAKKVQLIVRLLKLKGLETNEGSVASTLRKLGYGEESLK